MAKARRSAEKREFWTLVLQEYRESGLSVRAFCEREGLAEPSFYAWRKRLSLNATADGKSATNEAVRGGKLVPVRIVDEDRVEIKMKYLLTLILFSLFLFDGATFAAEKPNIVFILGDDQAWGDYGFMGHADVQTPNLDKLASRSLVFERGYVASPLCRPSLASMITGLYPPQHGITGNDVDGLSARATLDRPLREQFHRHLSFIRLLSPLRMCHIGHSSLNWATISGASSMAG